jgi:hypothetical protein
MKRGGGGMDWETKYQLALIGGHFILFLVCLQITIKLNTKPKDKGRRKKEIFFTTLGLFIWLEAMYWIVDHFST